MFTTNKLQTIFNSGGTYENKFGYETTKHGEREFVILKHFSPMSNGCNWERQESFVIPKEELEYIVYKLKNK